MSKLVVGCGYLGERVATAWERRGERVYAVTRSAERAARFRQLGLCPLVGDITEAIDWSGLADVDTVLFAVGFDRTAGKTIREVYVTGLQSVLQGLPPSVRRFLYISSTGVYGQTDGEWIDENSPCAPIREGGQACWEAEGTLRRHALLGNRAIILRLAGIYGPGRLPKLEELRARQPIRVDPSSYVNLIHVEDAVQAVLAAEQLDPPDLIVVSDGGPVLRGDFYRELAQQCGLPEPTFAPPEGAAAMAARGAGDKRINNRRMRDRLQLKLRYPSYKEGLAGIVASSVRSPDGLDAPRQST